MFGLFFRRKRFYTDVRQYADGTGKVRACCASQAQLLDCFAMSVISMASSLRDMTPGEYSDLSLDHFSDLLFARVREKMRGDGDATVLKEDLFPDEPTVFEGL